MKNHFDLIRLLAALAVFVSHAFPLNGMHEPKILWGYTTLGTLGVYTFFGLSGYLVMQSWSRMPCIKSFLWKRIKRIFPGLFFVVILLAFVYGPAISSLSLAEYLTDKQLFTFLRLAIMMGNDRLPGVLQDNPFPEAVNSSLWTLKYECLMYICLAIIANKTNRFPFIIEFIWGIFGFLNIFLCISPDLIIFPAYLSALQEPFNFLISFGGIFFTGTMIARYRNKLNNERFYILTALIIFLISCYFNVGGIIAWLIFPYMIVMVGELPYSRLINSNPKNDISYGMYIYAFPFQQLIVFLFGVDGSPASFILNSCVSLLVTILFAKLSWKLIESPFLKKRSYA